MTFLVSLMAYVVGNATARNNSFHHTQMNCDAIKRRGVNTSNTSRATAGRK
ncbi:hypothetical protein D3C83_195830 [compost metagenome]